MILDVVIIINDNILLYEEQCFNIFGYMDGIIVVNNINRKLYILVSKIVISSISIINILTGVL